MRKVSVALASLSIALAGCGTESSGADGGKDCVAGVEKVNGETVFPTWSGPSSQPYSDVNEMVASAPIVFEGTLRETKTIAFERVPLDSEEGVAPGDGADLYGTVAFDVTSVIKGDPNLKELTLAFETGTRDSKDKTRRIAYLLDVLDPIQKCNGELRSASELTGTKFIVFALPNDRYLPFGDYIPAVTNGIAVVAPDGTLRFGKDGSAPLTVKKPVTPAEVKAAAGK